MAIESEFPEAILATQEPYPAISVSLADVVRVFMDRHLHLPHSWPWKVGGLSLGIPADLVPYDHHPNGGKGD